MLACPLENRILFKNTPNFKWCSLSNSCMFGFMKTFGNYILTVSQLNDSRLWKPVLWATLLSLASLLLLLVIGGTFLFQLVDSFKDQLSEWMGWAGGWLGGLSVLLGTFFIGILGYFFLGSVYAAFLSIFLDDMLDAIREQHYPDADWIKPPGMIQSTISSLRFILFSLTLYLLASPLLLVGYFIPPVGLVLQYLLGGYLLGREYGQLIELRIPKDKRIKKPASLFHGTCANFLWTFPIINLVAPLLLAGALLHARLGDPNAPETVRKKYTQIN